MNYSKKTDLLNAQPRIEITRRGAIFGIIAGVSLTAPSLAIGRADNEIRRLHMVNKRTDESLNLVYWIDGEYCQDALPLIDYFMRDIREDLQIRMNLRNIDNLAATQRLLETDEPFTLISGYRTPKTNAALSRRNRSVAKNSLHIRGMAADIRLENRSVSQIARAAVSCGKGGVGKYTRSNFVHIDCGENRTW